MARNCPGCVPLTMQKRTRWVLVTDSLLPTDSRWYEADVIIHYGAPEGRSRHARARVVGAPAGYGGQRIGASTVVLWGRNTARLAELVEGSIEPIVVVALVPGTSKTGKALPAIRAACARRGRELHVIQVAERTTFHVDPQREPRVVFAPVRRGAPAL